MYTNSTATSRSTIVWIREVPCQKNWVLKKHDEKLAKKHANITKY